MLDILLAVLPAICWGSIVLVSVKLGGNAYSQTLGITFGALIFSIGALLIKTPDWNTTAWVVGIISGALWSVGQLGQLVSVKYMGVSKTVPISTGLQLVGTSLFGVIVFNEWSTQTQIIVGIIALILIIAGVILNSIGKDEQEESNKEFKKGMIVLLISTLGFIGYVVIIRWFEIDGWTAVLPQAIGMLIGALLMGLRNNPFTKYAVRNILTGLIWAAGNIALLISIPRIGVATSFSLSQTGIVISTLGGVFLLGEKKSKKRIVMIIIGCILVIAGGVLLGYTKK